MKKVLVLLAEGFEEVEALTAVDYLRRMDIIVDTSTINEKIQVKGAHGITVISDKSFDELGAIDSYDGLIIPGGLPGATNLRDNKKVIDLVKGFHKDKKLIGAICAGPIVLEKAGIIDEKKITSYPGFEEELKDGIYVEDLVVKDENIISARGPAVAVYFAIEIVKYLSGQEKAEELRGDILLDMVEDHIAKKNRNKY